MDDAREVVPPGGESGRGGNNGHDHGDGHQAVTEAAPAPPSPPAPPPTASARLRAAREAQGLSTTDIAARTRITIRHVQALDRGDLAALPGRPYVLGFIRNYARAVGLDGAELAEMARKEMDAGEPRQAPRVVHQYDVDDPAKTPSRLVTWVALGLVVAVLAAGAVFWRSYYSPDSALPSLAGPDQTTPATAAPRAPAPAAPAANAPVVFTAKADKIWVKFYDGHGKQLVQKLLATGETYTVPADAFEPKLWTGRPDALSVTVGGQAVPPISDKQVIVRDVPVSAQALLARGHPAPAPVAAPTPAPVTGATVAEKPRPVHHQVHHEEPDSSVPGPSTTTYPSAPVAAPAPAPAATQ